FPLVLVLFAIAAYLLLPERAFWASIAFALGLLGTPVLSAYMSPQGATLGGAVLAAVAAGLAFRSSRGWLIAVLGGLLGLVFLSAEHGALIAWILALLVLAVLLGQAPRRRIATA
ncbi:MAG: hypothetical protein QOJ65_2805, partial [Fimbriimonadaceae bacterium]|nr:hypothetical protein [Fimbriimonadaceae bacterium]